MKQANHISLVVGRLHCKPLRNFLKEQQFLGREIQFLESSGFIEREFIIKGDPEDLKKINYILRNWVQRLNQ